MHALTTAAADGSGAPEAEFEAAGSETETLAREETAGDVRCIATAYGFVDAGADAGAEEPIAVRER